MPQELKSKVFIEACEQYGTEKHFKKKDRHPIVDKSVLFVPVDIFNIKIS